MKAEEMRRAPKAVVVGGSIAGLSCAHALISAGWQVTVIEKSGAPPSGSPTGAGLGLDPQSMEIVGRWISNPDLLLDITLPLSIDLAIGCEQCGVLDDLRRNLICDGWPDPGRQLYRLIKKIKEAGHVRNRAIDSAKKISWRLARDESCNFRAAHWADLHSVIYKALPPEIVLWGHQFLSFQISNDKSSVVTKSRNLQTDEIVEIVGDLLVAADGCLSTIRQHFLPDLKLRYSGYSAWRGVLDFSGEENSDTMVGIRRAYPELGHCLYFDLADGTHCVLYELRNKRLNWVWFVNAPEPENQGRSSTCKASNDLIQKMFEEAEKVWVPELAKLMKETKQPFINVIYDADPLPQLFWDNVVLVGDAAHPVAPNGARSTNMSILDAETLGLCLKKWGLEKLTTALQEFQTIRHPVITKQVLHSRIMGRLKQGLPLHDNTTFDPKTASPEECKRLQHRNMPYFEHAPTCI